MMSLQGGLTALLCQKDKPWLLRCLCFGNKSVEHDEVLLPVLSQTDLETQLSGTWGKGGGALLWLNAMEDAEGFVVPTLSLWYGPCCVLATVDGPTHELKSLSNCKSSVQATT
jgi:hypothetical protein